MDCDESSVLYKVSVYSYPRRRVPSVCLDYLPFVRVTDEENMSPVRPSFYSHEVFMRHPSRTKKTKQKTKTSILCTLVSDNDSFILRSTERYRTVKGDCRRTQSRREVSSPKTREKVRGRRKRKTMVLDEVNFHGPKILMEPNPGKFRFYFYFSTSTPRIYLVPKKEY